MQTMDRLYFVGLPVLGCYFMYYALPSVFRLSNQYAEIMDKAHMNVRGSGLHDSWLTPYIHRRIDLKDAQWHNFRDGLPALTSAAMVFLLLSYGIKYFSTVQGFRGMKLLQVKSTFYSVFGILFIFVLFEMDAFLVLIVAMVNFIIAMILGKSSWAPYFTWGYIIFVLITMNFYGGVNYVDFFGNDFLFVFWNDHRGMMRWHVSFNLFLLRMQSFNMDYWWSVQSAAFDHDTDQKKRPKDCASPIWSFREDLDMNQDALSNLDEDKRKKSLGLKRRVNDYHPVYAYTSTAAYVGYVLYAPLYIAGPVITFNAYVSYLVAEQNEYPLLGKIKYVLRNALNFLLMEIFTHYVYVGAITHMSFRYTVPEHDPSSGRYIRKPLIEVLCDNGKGVLDVADVAFYSYFALKFLWLKFMLIWRFFRTWAVLDDICPPENMARCMSNNYSVGGFWRSWHCSFNRWLVRYLYIPLGGNAVSKPRQVVNIAAVFTFVALWHDIEPHLFAWAWLFTLFLVPDLVVNEIVKVPSVKAFFNANPISEMVLGGLCGGGSIIMLKLANIIGYTIGLDAIGLLMPMLQSIEGILFFSWYLLVMSAAAMGMIQLRKIEAKRDKKTE